MASIWECCRRDERWNWVALSVIINLIFHLGVVLCKESSSPCSKRKVSRTEFSIILRPRGFRLRCSFTPRPPTRHMAVSYTYFGLILGTDSKGEERSEGYIKRAIFPPCFSICIIRTFHLPFSIRASFYPAHHPGAANYIHLNSVTYLYAMGNMSTE